MLAILFVLVSSCKNHDGGGPGTDPGLSGKLDFRITDTESGALLCAAELELLGSPYTGGGECRDCDFRFEMETTVVSEDGPACEEMYADYYDLALLPYEQPIYEDTVFIGFADTYHLHGGDYMLRDVLLVGHAADGGVPYLIPGFWDNYLQTVSYADGQLEWTHDSDAAAGVTAQVDGQATIAL